MRSLDAAELAQLATGKINSRWLLWIIGADPDTGDPVTAGWWKDAGLSPPITVQDLMTGTTPTRTYKGSGKIIEFGTIELRATLAVRNMVVKLNILDGEVNDFVRGNTLRNRPAQIHRVFLDPISGLPVATAKTDFDGFINEAPIFTGERGGQSWCELRLVSQTRELTRDGTEKRSDAAQQRRVAGDTFFQYAAVMGARTFPWAQNNGTIPTSGGSAARPPNFAGRGRGIGV